MKTDSRLEPGMASPRKRMAGALHEDDDFGVGDAPDHNGPHFNNVPHMDTHDGTDHAHLHDHERAAPIPRADGMHAQAHPDHGPHHMHHSSHTEGHHEPLPRHRQPHHQVTHHSDGSVTHHRPHGGRRGG